MKCQHEAYVCEHPRTAGWIVYCADCDDVSVVKPTKEEAIAAWHRGEVTQEEFDRMELTGFELIDAKS